MKNWRFLVSVGLVCGLLTSCKDKIDLAHIDTRMEADLGLVLPIGSAHASFADLLLTKTLGENFILEDGILTYKQTLEYNVNFHPIDGQQFMGQGEQTLPIPMMLPSGQHTITIPIELTLANVNTDVANERIDSLLLTQAILSSSITKTGLDELDWTWIENITLHLGNQMYSAKGKDIPIYCKGDLGGFDQPLPALLEDVSLSFMVNKNLDPTKDDLDTYNANVGNTWSLSATIQLNVPTGQTLTPGSLSYNYSFAVTGLKAIWGYFKPSDDLKVKDKINLAEQWDFWKKLNKVVLPFDRPSIQFDVNTSISATVELDVKEIYMASATEDTVYATFNGERQTTYFFDDHIGLDPASLGQRTTYSAAIDNTEQQGRLDRCFEIAPDVCAFAFNIVPTDPQTHPVMRLVNDAKPMEVNLTTRFPFSFKPGVHVFYTDTLRDINFSQVALDSLLKQVQVVEEVKQADLNLYIHATNDIPLDITGTFVFQDKDGQDLHILDSALVFKASDTTTYVVTVRKEDFDRIARTKQITIDADGNDLSMQSHPERYPIQVTGESGLKLFFGFAGNIDAILNFNNLK